MESHVIDALITAVFNRPPVWNRNNKKHCNRYAVDKCWSEIAAELGVDEHKLRKKWKYLRDHFSVEFSKIPIAARDDISSHGTKWPHFHSLTFLKDVVKLRKSTGHMTKTGRSSRSSSIDQTRSFDSQDESNDNVKKECHEAYSISENQFDSLDEVDDSREAAGTFNKRNLDPVTTPGQRQKRMKCNEQERCHEDDEHVYFFKSLLPHVRKIPEHRLFSFRNSIHEIVDRFAYQK